MLYCAVSCFDLSQFGIMLSGDTILVEFHLNDHVEKLWAEINVC